MDYRDLCRKAYAEAIQADQTIDSDFRRALRAHERVPAFIDRLADQLVYVQSSRLRKQRPIHNDHTIREVVKDMTRVFIRGISSEATARYESDISKLVRQSKADEVKQLDDAIDGNYTGEFEELGIIQLDSRGTTNGKANDGQGTGAAH